VGLFQRAGLPDELVTRNVDRYVAAACKMIDDEDWRAECRATVAGCDFDAAFYRGDPALFCQAVADLIAAKS
jgi:hypothetical protein